MIGTEEEGLQDHQDLRDKIEIVMVVDADVIEETEMIEEIKMTEDTAEEMTHVIKTNIEPVDHHLKVAIVKVVFADHVTKMIVTQSQTKESTDILVKTVFIQQFVQRRIKINKNSKTQSQITFLTTVTLIVMRLVPTMNEIKLKVV